MSVQGVTVRRDLALLHHVLGVARKEWNYPMRGNVVGEIRLPKPPKARERRPDQEEVEAVLDACRRSRAKLLAPVVRFAMETGMRRGEIVEARWTHVDWDSNVLHVPQSKNGHSRDIPLSTRALAILEALPRDHGRIFPTTANAIRLAWERARDKAKVADLHFHDLRHEAISRLFERGLSVPEVALISGHRDYRMLFRYTHLRASDLVAKLG